MCIREFFTILAFIFIAGSCCNLHETITKDPFSFTKQAESRYGNNYKYIYNNDSAYVLIINQKKPSAENPFPLLKFFIYDIGNHQIIFEDIIPKSKVYWKDVDQIQVDTTPGIVSTENSDNKFGYVYNLKLKKKIDLK